MRSFFTSGTSPVRAQWLLLLVSSPERVCPVCLQARVEEVVGWAWDVFQPLLFGLIGAEIRVSELEGHTVGEAADTHTHTHLIPDQMALSLLTFKCVAECTFIFA